MIALVAALLLGQALSPYSQLGSCGYADPGKGCTIPMGALWILPNGAPTPSYASGSLSYYSNGVIAGTVTDIRASNAYCFSGTKLVQLANNAICVDAPMATNEYFGGATFTNPLGGGLRVEAGQTNSLLQSQTLNNAAWTATGGSITSVATAGAPDGTSTANVWTSSVANSQHQITQSVTTTAAGWTFSVFAKAGTYSWIGLNWNSTHSVAVNLSSGAFANPIPSASNQTNVVVSNVGGGWFRASISFTATAASTALTVCFGDSQAHADPNGGACPTWNDATGGTVNVWGAQGEAASSGGGGFPSSYNPTVSVGVARVHDVESVPNPVSGSGAFAGALTITQEMGWDGFTYGWLSNGTTFGTGNIWNLNIFSGSYELLFASTVTATNSFTGTPNAIGSVIRYAFTATPAPAETIFVNGTSEATGTTALPTQSTTIGIGNIYGQGGSVANAWFTQVCIDPSGINCK